MGDREEGQKWEEKKIPREQLREKVDSVLSADGASSTGLNSKLLNI